MESKTLMYLFSTPGKSTEFTPSFTLKGFEKIEKKDSRRFHKLMSELKYECQKLEVHFSGEVYETKDLKK